MAIAPDDVEIVTEFLVESHEALDRLDRELLILERNPRDAEQLASVFRTIHTIKGTSGFLAFHRLETLTHAGESLLSLLRDGERVFDNTIASALLSMVDAVRKMLTCVESDGTDGEDDYAPLVENLAALCHASAGPTPAPAVAAHKDLSLAQPVPVVEPEPAAVSAEQALCAAAGETKRPDLADPVSGVADNSIRVDVGLLDKLMNLVGELVLARNQVLQFSAAYEAPLLAATSQRLNLITTELQESVMKTRMQPIGNVWAKFPRLARDVAAACGKHVVIEMEGKETGLDKTIIEAIRDPLTHIVRNSIDHGLESPEVRSAAQKPPEGRLFLRAFHEGGQVNIEITDDGAGIDIDKVKHKAVQRGLLTREQADRISEREALNLIFLPGFSTADKVSNISGRGVGMDVVRTNIEQIGGSVDVQTRRGQGTTIRIRIPLTLAIIPALIVWNEGERFAIPQISLLELVRLESPQSKRSIEWIHGSPVYRLRGTLLPLVALTNLFRQSGGPESGKALLDMDVINIVVLQAGDRHFGLVVTSIQDTEEIVVKPLGKQLKGIPTFSGATIMGDGKVALILDVLGIAHHARVISEQRERNTKKVITATDERAAAKQSLLICELGTNGRAVIPLALVDRLEEFPAHRLERTGRTEVLQYRGQILRLVRLDDLVPHTLRGPADDNDAAVKVVVYRQHDQQLGLVVHRVVDIVEDVLTVEPTGKRPGVLGSAIIQGRITEVLDVPGAIDALGGVA